MINLYNANSRWCAINLSDSISSKSAKLLLGNGTKKNHPLEKGKKYLEKWDREIDFESIFYQVEKRCSEYGWSLILPNRSKTGRISLDIALPWQQKQIAFISQEVGAINVYSRVQYADNSPIMKTTYTDTKITRQFGQLDNNRNFAINAHSAKIAKDLVLPTEEIHNLGFVPVIFIPNLPYQDPYNTVNPFAYPDMSPVRNLQRLLDHVHENLWKEIQNNITRIIGNFTQQEMEYKRIENDPFVRRNSANKNLIKLMQSDLFINSRQEATTGAPIIPMIADPKFQSYTSLMNDIIQWAYEFSGYSWTEDVATQKTESEVVLMSARDAETTRIKRTMRTRLYKKLLYTLGRLEGEDDWFCNQFSFEINENIAVDRFKQVELSKSLIDARLSTRVDEIAKLSGLTEEDAKIKLEEIDAEYRKNIESMIPIYNEEPKNNGVSI